MESMSFIVFVKTDEAGRITAVNSSAFLTDLTGWIEIDSGDQMKHRYAMWNYFDKPLVNEWGLYRYKLEGGKAVERTREEMDADYVPPVPAPSDTERIAALEAAMTAIEEGIASV